MDGEEDGVEVGVGVGGEVDLVEDLAGEPVWAIPHGQGFPVDGDGGIHGVEHGIPLAGGKRNMYFVNY